MPNGRLDIGQNIGDAGVWNSQPAVQAFTNVLAQQKAKRDAERQALVQQMGSLKTDGLRDADRDDYYNAYNDWKNTAIQANNAQSNTRQKLDLQGAALQKYNQLNDFVGKSKQAGVSYLQNANQLHNDAMRHQYKDDAIDKFLAVKDRPMNSVEFQTYSDLNNLARQVDHTKVDNAIEKSRDQALEPIVAQRFQTKGVRGDRSGTWVDQKKIIPYDGENGVYHRLLNAATASPDFQKSLDDRYQNIQGQTPKETLALQVQQYAKDKGYDKGWVKPVGSSEFQEVDNSFDEFKRKRQYIIDHPIKDATATIPSQPTDITIPYNNGKSNVQIKGYIPLSIPSKNFGGSAAYNLTTGQQVPALESSGDYSVVGVGNVPFIKKGSLTNSKLEGTIAQPDFINKSPQSIEQRPMVHVQKKATNKFDKDQDFLIDYNRLPENIKNSKSIKQALGNFKPAGQSSETDVPNGKGKTATMQQINSLAGKKGYEGYTPKELADYYKSLGYKIK